MRITDEMVKAAGAVVPSLTEETVRRMLEAAAQELTKVSRKRTVVGLDEGVGTIVRCGVEDRSKLIAAMEFGPRRQEDDTQPAAAEPKTEPYYRKFDNRKF